MQDGENLLLGMTTPSHGSLLGTCGVSHSRWPNSWGMGQKISLAGIISSVPLRLTMPLSFERVHHRVVHERPQLREAVVRIHRTLRVHTVCQQHDVDVL